MRNYLQVISEASNFKLIAVADDKDFIEEFTSSTGLDGPRAILDSKSWANDKYLTAHVSDLYRLMLLYQEGGIYYDTDVISIQV